MTTRLPLMTMIVATGLLSAPMLANGQSGVTPLPPAPPAPSTTLATDAAPGTVPGTTQPGSTQGVTPTPMPGPATGSATAPALPARPDSDPPGNAATRAIDSAIGTNLSGANAPGAVTQQPAGVKRASAVIGATVINEQDETIGRIDDLLIGDTPMPMTAVLSVGGFLGIGAKRVSVPMNELRWDESRERFVMAGATRDSIRALPEFSFAERRG